MYQKLFFTFLLALVVNTLSAQIIISGAVKNARQQPLAGVSILLENSYSGGTSGDDGHFSFSTSDTGYKKLIISLLGYTSLTQEIVIRSSAITISAVLKEAITELNAVTVTAGSFEASDRKRSTVLRPLDIVTTPGQEADIVATIKTLPGAQQVGEAEGLFIRGGTGYEAKVFIDGLMINNPFLSSVPDVAQRSRFSPLQFKGTFFSSGGYSAQYGQALSSVLLLETLDLPTRTESNFLISSAQLSATWQQLNKARNASTGFTINYSNLAPYYGAVSQKYHFTKAPEMVNAEMNARKKWKSGILKLYGYANYNTIGFDKPSIQWPKSKEVFGLTNHNILGSLTYNGTLGSNWKIYAGASYSFNKDTVQQYILADTAITPFLPGLTNNLAQSKLVFTRQLTGFSKLYAGAEYQYATDQVVAFDSIPHITLHNNYVAVFIESEIYITAKFAGRAGIRYEYSSLLRQGALAPRLSIAYKLNENSQVAAAFGEFYQRPEANLLFRNSNLSFAKATHYILNYQRVANGQTLRAELFYKNYNHLVTYEPNTLANIKTEGSGYAKGVELFWRDKKTFRGFDYWIAYSFLDTKRQFLDYPFAVQPNFAAKNTAIIVIKRFVEAIATNFSMSYTYSEGRPYYNPNKPVNDFMSDRTIDFHTVGFQVNYLTHLGKAYTAFILNISNVLGNKQVYGYHYSASPDNTGWYIRETITPQAKRFFFIGAYMSIGTDHRKEIIDN